MSTSFCLLDLPNEILLHIFSYLGHRDLNNILLTNWRCKQVAENEDVWRNFCERHWLLTEKQYEKSSWKENFRLKYEEYGRYIDLYPIILGAWKKLTNILQTEIPKIMASLKDGISEAELDAFEEDYACKLPESLRLFYRICGGQESNNEDTPGLFGSFFNVFSDSFCTYMFQSLSCLTQVHPQPGKSDMQYRMLTLSKANYGNEFCLILPDKTKNVPQTDGFPRLSSVVWATSNKIYAESDSFQDWFLDYVDKITEKYYDITNERIFRYYFDPEFVARTGPITVRAGWTCSQLYRGNYMLFEYRIKMSMDEDANVRDSCKLLERHWTIIHSENNKEERVSGPGVVGEFPVMRPGAQYAWMSRTYFTSPGGSMGGYFTMQNLATSNIIRVECPRYYMKFPRPV